MLRALRLNPSPVSSVKHDWEIMEQSSMPGPYDPEYGVTRELTETVWTLREDGGAPTVRSSPPFALQVLVIAEQVEGEAPQVGNMILAVGQDAKSAASQLRKIGLPFEYEGGRKPSVLVLHESSNSVESAKNSALKFYLNLKGRLE